MNRRTFLPAALAALALPSVSVAEPDTTAVQRWIERCARLTTVEGDFTQQRHLRTLKKPLESTGKFWATAAGSLRWQAGDPPKVIAVRQAGKDLFLADTEKKKAEQHTPASLEKDGAGPALALLEAGFPRSFDDFRKRFTIVSVTAQGDYDEVELTLAGDSGTFAVRKVLLRIYRPTAVLGSLEIHLRDGSWISSTFTRMEENKAVEEAMFTIDLKGYEVKKP